MTKKRNRLAFGWQLEGSVEGDEARIERLLDLQEGRRRLRSYAGATGSLIPELPDREPTSAPREGWATPIIRQLGPDRGRRVVKSLTPTERVESEAERRARLALEARFAIDL